METDRKVWTYYVSRDSFNGVLTSLCDVWWIKPLRVKHGARVTWVGADTHEPGHMSRHTVDEIIEIFRVAPDNDRQLVKAERWATAT